MSATPPVPPKAKQQQKQQTIKQQRAEERARKLEEHRRREARSKRNRRIGIVARPTRSRTPHGLVRLDREVTRCRMCGDYRSCWYELQRRDRPGSASAIRVP